MDQENKALTNATEVKKSPLKKAMSIFLVEDSAAVQSNLYDDYIKPRTEQFKKDATRKALEFVCDTLQNCISMVLLGEKTTRNSGLNDVITGGNTNYVRFYTGNGTTENQKLVSKPILPMGGILKEYAISEWSIANSVYQNLCAYLARYKRVPIAYYYELIGVTPSDVHHYYGWVKLDNVEIVSTPEGYVLNLPQPIPLG